MSRRLNSWGRRKQKWAVDPRNTAWSNDDSKFGQKMLEKMGWSKGKGLGAQEQGATEHIKVKVKNNHLGLGATNNNEFLCVIVLAVLELTLWIRLVTNSQISACLCLPSAGVKVDSWIAHQDDFNQLLAALNTCHGQETAAELLGSYGYIGCGTVAMMESTHHSLLQNSSDNKEKKSFSLEEKSKISKKRVHYMKFTKGKDLSSRSETDLDCIFGKRRNKKLAQDKDDCSNSANEVDTCLSTTTTTTTSAFTIQEYFAKRMAQLKSKPQASAPGSDLSESLVEWKKGKKKNKEAACIDVENSPQHKAKRHKKKKRVEAERCSVAKKRDQAELQPGGPSGDECSDASVEAAEDCVQTPDRQDDDPKPKKRKAKKKLQRPREVTIDTMLDRAPVKKKKKVSR
ncbi:PIN2/TERF1-interacting telomerase inhibitor 1 [Apodemus speciosus]|uniref:PIN2/TERF1-interacting telomerase inhibitor 1 n=1 Tax=Apodemus speciosus TaxID=105296 RepID=A0ABQ0FIF8_APOSI